MADLYEQIPQFARAHRLARIPEGVSGRDDGDEYEARQHDEADGIKDAHVITSHDPTTGKHRPILDIDLPAALIPSSTPGHYHLYIDKPMEWDRYEDLLDALSAVGIIEEGYASASCDREYTSVRLPWIKKSKEN